MIYNKTYRTKAYLEFKQQMAYIKSFEVLHHFSTSSLGKTLHDNQQIKSEEYGILNETRYNNFFKNQTKANLSKLMIISSFSLFEEYCKRVMEELFKRYFVQLTSGLRKEEKRLKKKFKDLERYFHNKKREYITHGEGEKIKELRKWKTAKGKRLKAKESDLVSIFEK